MIPINTHPNYTYILITLPYPHSSPPLSLTALTLTPTQEDMDPCVKLEEEDSKRSTIADPFPSSSPKEGQQRRAATRVSEGSSGGGSKKEFKKDRKCPVHSCNKRYSSRIAQRAHIRK